jgi:hypothetical protein
MNGNAGQDAGRFTYLKPDVIAKLRQLAKGGQYGEVVEVSRAT